MTAYFDTSVITKWYVPEVDSEAALRLRDRFTPPLPLTHLHRVELASAWQLKVFRKEMKDAAVALAQADLGTDLEAGLWVPPAYDLASVFDRAGQMAGRHTRRLGVRSLDILHVAAALELSAATFVTADVRQGKLASACRLRAVVLGGA